MSLCYGDFFVAIIYFGVFVRFFFSEETGLSTKLPSFFLPSFRTKSKWLTLRFFLVIGPSAMSFQSFSFLVLYAFFFFHLLFPSIYFVFGFCPLSVFFNFFQHSQAPLDSQEASWHPSFRSAPTYDSEVDLLIHSWEVFILISSFSIGSQSPFGSHGGLLW